MRQFRIDAVAFFRTSADPMLAAHSVLVQRRHTSKQQRRSAAAFGARGRGLRFARCKAVHGAGLCDSSRASCAITQPCAACVWCSHDDIQVPTAHALRLAGGRSSNCCVANIRRCQCTRLKRLGRSQFRCGRSQQRVRTTMGGKQS